MNDRTPKVTVRCVLRCYEGNAVVRWRGPETVLENEEALQLVVAGLVRKVKFRANQLWGHHAGTAKCRVEQKGKVLLDLGAVKTWEAL